MIQRMKNWALTGVAALAFWLGGCTATPSTDKDAPKTDKTASLAIEDLSALRADYKTVTEDAELSRSEFNKLIANYLRMKKTGIAADANEEVRAWYATLVQDHKKMIADAYNHADLRLYIGVKSDVNTLGHKDIPLGKGAQYLTTLDKMLEVLDKSVAEHKPYKADKHGVIPAQQVLGRGVSVNRADVAKFLEGGKTFGTMYVPAGYLDGAVLASLTDGNSRNGELRGTPEHLVVSAVYNGHKLK